MRKSKPSLSEIYKKKQELAGLELYYFWPFLTLIGTGIFLLVYLVNNFPDYESLIMQYARYGFPLLFFIAVLLNVIYYKHLRKK